METAAEMKCLFCEEIYLNEDVLGMHIFTKHEYDWKRCSKEFARLIAAVSNKDDRIKEMATEFNEGESHLQLYAGWQISKKLKELAKRK